MAEPGIWLAILAIASLFSSSLSLDTNKTTTLETSVPTSMTIQKSVSFEARGGKAYVDDGEPIIMQMRPNDSYFPVVKTKSTEPPPSTTTTTVSSTPSTAEPPKDSSNEVNEPKPQASSLSYSARWTPLEQNILPLTAPAQPIYFPAPALYGYPVNNYAPPIINFGGETPNPQAAYDTTGAAEVKQEEPAKEQSNLFNIPVKSIEYVVPLKSEYAPAQEKLPQYNAIRKPYDENPKDSSHYDPAVSSSYGAPGHISPTYGAPGPVSGTYGPPGPNYGAPGPVAPNYHGGGATSFAHSSGPLSGTYGPPLSHGYGLPSPSYGSPENYDGPTAIPGPVYGPPKDAYGPPKEAYGPPAVKKHVENVHQKVLHRYNHHQKVLHEHNLHRYIVHNYHLHRYHVHNYHNHKEHIHVNKEHIHEKHQQKVTEEHKTKETAGETHKHVTEVKESQRHLPPVQAPLHVVKPQWSVWG